MASPPIQATALCAWRHPKPQGAAGRCIGHTDLPLDRRKAKRLAHRIRQAARRQQWPRVIHTSPLQRCASVGQQLKRWGWQHHVHAELSEMSFGDWEGLPWSAIGHAEVDAWCAEFLHARPGQGESLQHLFSRVQQWADTHAAQPHTNAQTPAGKADPHAPCLVVAHAGCMQAWQWLASGQPLPTQAAQWTKPPAYGACWRWPHALFNNAR